ncbi:hypothetical protein [Streptomyces sp. NPDC050145]
MRIVVLAAAPGSDAAGKLRLLSDLAGGNMPVPAAPEGTSSEESVR